MREYIQVLRDKKWKDVTGAFSFPSSATNASFILRKYYYSLLVHYEQIYFFRAAAWNHETISTSQLKLLLSFFTSAAEIFTCVCLFQMLCRVHPIDQEKCPHPQILKQLNPANLVYIQQNHCPKVIFLSFPFLSSSTKPDSSYLCDSYDIYIWQVALFVLQHAQH